MLLRVKPVRLQLRRPFLSQRDLTTLGLRREDPARVWERRTALTPEAVEQLLAERNGQGKEGLKVEVESCGRRCFTDHQYSAAGAQIVPSLGRDVDVVLGIKEPPLKDVHALLKAGEAEGKRRTWMMFSHTHKGQEYNTPLLAAFLLPTKGQTLIDHELLTAPKTGKDGKEELKRVAAFGWYAGAVGAGEALSLTGLALLKRGIASPLLHLPRPYTFNSLADFKASLKKTGDALRSAAGTSSGPVVIGLTGAGNVSSGARDILDVLGVEWTTADQLPTLKDAASSNKIYACAIPPSSYLITHEGSPYSREEYRRSPELYRSTFAEKIAPHITTLINGVGWGASFPRTMSNQDLKGLLSQAEGKQQLIAVQDISCDKEGGLEFVNKYTTIDEPYFEGPNGMLISSIDILPTELAADASAHFSEKILPFVRRALFPDAVEGDKVGETVTLRRAAIVNDGQITEPHQWLLPRVEAWRKSTSSKPATPEQSQGASLRKDKKKVLLLGSGLVAGPAVEVFASRPDVHLVIASNNVSEARGHIRDRSNVEALSLDVSDDSALGEAVAAADVIVSLLPAPMHPLVAKHCIAKGRHLVTASYVSPEMKALDKQAQESDVLLLGECGLDPGIDSMAAMRILDRVQREGKKVTSFVSWCGGLPELSASQVPLRYKFSWSPKAVLTAAQNDAQFKWEGKTVNTPGDQLLAQHFPSVKLWDELPLEGLANRDSMPYAEKYGLGPIDDLTNLFRGTLRYQGFSTLLDSFRKLGLLRSDPLKTVPQTWDGLLLSSAGRELGLTKGLRSGDMESVLRDIVGTKQAEETQDALKWFGLLPGDTLSPVPLLPRLSNPTNIDLFAHLLSKKLAYSPGERDSCLLHHAFELTSPAGQQQNVTASLLCYGDENASAMSVTVGKTLAFAALRVVDGHVKRRGVTGPYEREVWEGVLDKLEEVGVVVEEKWN
ncbi:hypothetical protein CI109_101804 [Kwoniella shandongensis]|uniref:Uncharacterized protein n=1 Tax=Kwoniella shandongensis TaxID=1734106 RepID=A0A5M6C595_9TREE|nr:uncharacterized protein CI109_001074 [Kwoniella shandongensis]KAA5530274.1 hypothetical protein CI109_001074 [Kwoniella shandongensis]